MKTKYLWLIDLALIVAIVIRVKIYFPYIYFILINLVKIIIALIIFTLIIIQFVNEYKKEKLKYKIKYQHDSKAQIQKKIKLEQKKNGNI
jgi:membrane protein YdbS with pleckstrin-like domain